MAEPSDQDPSGEAGPPPSIPFPSPTTMEGQSPLRRRPRRFYPAAFLMGLVAWCVIAALVFYIAGYRGETSETAAHTNAKDSLNILTMQLQARYLIGLHDLASNTLVSDRQIADQAKALNAGPIDQRLRYAVVAGELQGPDEALHALDNLERLVAEKNVTFTKTQSSNLAILRRLYGDYRQLRFDAPSVTESERQQLQDSLGWFGNLALAPPGEPGLREKAAAVAGGPVAGVIRDAGPDPAARDAALQPARRVIVVVLSVVAAVLILLFFGLVGLVALVIVLVLGQLQGGLKCGFTPAGVYAETFALWLLVFLGLSLGVSLGVRELDVGRSVSLLATGLAMLASLVVLVWPVLRGLRWRQVREDIGWTLGRRPAAEPIIGVGCYVLNYPAMVAGLIIVLILMAVQQSLQGGGLGKDDLASPSTPSHPIVAPLAAGDWETRLVILLLASVFAPIVEETIFRGVLYRHLRELTRWSGMAASIVLSGVISSFIFAVIHPQGLLAVPVLMALAFGFVLAREWRGTLIPCMIAHGLNNGLVMLVSIGMLGE